MALSPHLLHSPIYTSSPPPEYLLFCPSQWQSPLISIQKAKIQSLAPIAVKVSVRVRCLTKSTEEDHLSEIETLVSDDGDYRGDARKDAKIQDHPQKVAGSYSDSISLGIREPVYEVVEVKSNGMVSTRKINRRQLLKSSGLRPRDIRSVDPSLFLTNSMPSLLVREHALLLNLGSLRAIAMRERVLIFDYNRKGGKAFIDTLLPRLNPRHMNGGPSMPFELEVHRKAVDGQFFEGGSELACKYVFSSNADEFAEAYKQTFNGISEATHLEVVEAALLSRVQRLEQRLMAVEPRVQALLEVLPNRLTAHILEDLRISKQTLVELGSRAGAMRQMLLDLLEDTHEIRRICIMGRNCTLVKGNDNVECSVPLEKQIAEEEEEEIEMLLENYLQRCESCHGQAERLLDSAKEMEDSIAVNLSSRRLEVSRVELLLQVGTFCVAVGALVAGIFGMNLKSYLEEHVFAFWLTTAGIIVGAVVGFFLMYWYLRIRKIL